MRAHIPSGSRTDRSAIEYCRLARGSDPPLIRYRLVDDAQDRAAAPGQRDQCAEQRNPADEGLGSVDRIENPDELGILAYPAELLPDNTVPRKMRLDQLAHRRFRRPIGGGHRGQIGLVVDDQSLAEMRANYCAGGVGQAQRESEKSVELNFGHGPILAFRDRR